MRQKGTDNKAVSQNIVHIAVIMVTAIRNADMVIGS